MVVHLTNTSTTSPHPPSADEELLANSFFFSLIIRLRSSIIFFRASSRALAASDFLAESGVVVPGDDFVLDEAGLFLPPPADFGLVDAADLVGLDRRPFNIDEDVFCKETKIIVFHHYAPG